MRQWKVINDRVVDIGEVDYLGYKYDDILSRKVDTLPTNYDGWFPFMRMCYSIGDLGITSGIFEALKTKYPNIKIALPSKEYIIKFFGDYINRWNYNDSVTAIDNYNTIIYNNPYIDYFFNFGEFDIIYTDHERSYTGTIHDGDMIRSIDEPLAEQILRRFGFTDDDILNIDSRPKIYFTEEEIYKCDAIINKYIGDVDYGCLLFSARLDKYKGRWEEDKLLYKHSERIGEYPIFYYSDFDLENTFWGKFYSKRINFADIEEKPTIREQIYIKQHAKFNIGYQSGVNETSSGGTSEMISLSPYKTIRENCIRGCRYIFFDGKEKLI